MGQQIADSLDEHDLLSRWMAQHLAERLAALESLKGRARLEAEDAVAELILQIWAHRREVGFRRDPLAATDSVERAIARLDPEAKGLFSYFRPFDDEPGPSVAEIETNQALKLALAVDRIGEDLVRALVTYAALTAIDHDADWVRASDAIHPTTFRRLERLISYEGSSDTDAAPLEVAEKRVSERARSLGKLVRLASKLAAADQ
ncbi:hypothetical protein [Microcella humidisoli]|uniref:Uncharacterized protein n=1 Tax=Microcella humidisoli TaxID=2963406 RepID=A0ABY5FZB5_9MICO|nr:hypothetical protein [Microcella humidisoli]UTT63675.1 hypothetical protein NNL39_06160 [Microcella humidisoli]